MTCKSCGKDFSEDKAIIDSMNNVICKKCDELINNEE